MSYILDALRKADAERERGSVPNIHAQPLVAGLPLDPAARIGGGFGGLGDGARRWLIGGAAAGLVAVLALVLLRLTAPDAPAVAVPAAVVDSGRPSVAEPLDPPVPALQPATATPSTAVANPSGYPRPAPAPLAAVPTYRPVPAAPALRARSAAEAGAPRPSVSEMAAPVPAQGVSSRSAAGVAGTSPPAATAATALPAAEPAPQTAADNRVYQTRDLPDDIRRELPVLTVGGATYSENAASRMLIINGQVFHENDRLAPELVLERIQLRSAVLRYKGLRYSIAY